MAFDPVRRRYGVPREFILFVGTLEPRKNLGRILEAFRLLKTEQHFGPDLVLVGRKGWLCDPIFSRLSTSTLSKDVHLTGYVSDHDLLALYKMARLLVFPSLYEGFGLPAIEAMACGCPVVTSNRGALQEVTAGCALHCDPESIRSIAEAVWRTHTDESLRRELISQGLQRAASFSWKRYGEQFLETLGVCLPEESSHLCPIS